MHRLIEEGVIDFVVQVEELDGPTFDHHVARVKYAGDVMGVRRQGRLSVVVVALERFEELLELESLADPDLLGLKMPTFHTTQTGDS